MNSSQHLTANQSRATAEVASPQRSGRHRQLPPSDLDTTVRSGRVRLLAVIAAICLLAGVITILAVRNAASPSKGTYNVSGEDHGLSTVPGTYIGVYPHGAPKSYAGAEAFAAATGIKPRVVVYYSGWLESFQLGFVETVAHNGAVPLVQIDPEKVSVAAIAAGEYDSYLSTYAEAVSTYHRPVILSFGHEMNGYWYSWGNSHTSPQVFIAAWRHIVTIFRAHKTQNVTWLWTVNTIHKSTHVPAPAPWWPGSSYVDWVGIDGYFTDSSSVFSSVFGPTIENVRTLTQKPILIAETAATQGAGQPAKVADLFAGIHLYRLLGFIWFNSSQKTDWRLVNPASINAFRQYAEKYHEPR